MNKTFSGTGQYVASSELMSAVNIAVTLEKPLLVKGEPRPWPRRWGNSSSSGT